MFYVNPKHCAHRYVSIIRIKNTEYIYASCRVCSLQGEPVKIGWFDWLAKSKAFKKFFQLATELDKEDPNDATE
jgi:hypothetical protein